MAGTVSADQLLSLTEFIKHSKQIKKPLVITIIIITVPDQTVSDPVSEH